jgi:hypothetical protein
MLTYSNQADLDFIAFVSLTFTIHQNCVPEEGIGLTAAVAAPSAASFVHSLLHWSLQKAFRLQARSLRHNTKIRDILDLFEVKFRLPNSA